MLLALAASPIVIPREANPKAFGEQRGPPERTVRYGRGSPGYYPAPYAKGNSVVQSGGFLLLRRRNDGEKKGRASLEMTD